MFELHDLLRGLVGRDEEYYGGVLEWNAMQWLEDLFKIQT